MHALANAGQMTNHRYIELTYVVAETEEEEEQRDYSRVSKVTQAVIQHSAYSAIGSSSCLKQKNIRKLFPQTLRHCETLNEANNVASIPVKKGELTSEKNASFKSVNPNMNGTVGGGLNASVSTGASLNERRLSKPMPDADNTINGSSIKSIPMLRKVGLAGEIEDKVTTDFMRLMDYMQDQQSSKVSDQVFRNNYRKRSQQPGKKQFASTNFIQPTTSPTKTNILTSSNTFRTLTA